MVICHCRKNNIEFFVLAIGQLNCNTELIIGPLPTCTVSLLGFVKLNSQPGNQYCDRVQGILLAEIHITTGKQFRSTGPGRYCQKTANHKKNPLNGLILPN